MEFFVEIDPGPVLNSRYVAGIVARVSIGHRGISGDGCADDDAPNISFKAVSSADVCDRSDADKATDCIRDCVYQLVRSWWHFTLRPTTFALRLQNFDPNLERRYITPWIRRAVFLAARQPSSRR